MLKRRIEALEQRALVAPDVLVIVGEPDSEQQAMLDTGKARVVIRLPDNGRDRHERTA